MSKQINDGGPAFPLLDWTHDGQSQVAQYSTGGMTLRDYFAAKAMQAIVWGWTEGEAKHAANMANESYAFADAMLAARESKPADSTLLAQRDALLEALEEARTTLVVTESNILHAEQADKRWEGVPAKIRQRIKDIDAALASVKGGAS